ncbi:ABC transporter ATP-binding protein [Actinocrinis puniceicyclus]|uniref:ABC transporter ATP-binding protein n=1 Tax=Actinocrinis puniceicyclus TaxID=977794 RepID=UPI003F68A93E
MVQQFPRTGQQPLRVLDGIDLAVRPGEFAAIIGPSGSGKSTLFNIIAGLDRPAGGEVRIDGRVATGHNELVSYMPQKDLLFPWRTIQDNAALGLEVQGVSRRAARERVRPLFADFGLDGFERSYPGQLSGGMRQRAALLRTVAMGRPLLLLDEPFGALDSLTRTQMQLWLAGMWQRHGWTVLLVTHDIREAVFLADSVYVFTPRPARLAARIVVSLPRPRTAQTFLLPEFAAREQEVLGALGLPAQEPGRSSTEAP